MYIYDGGIINGQQLYNNRSGYTTTTRTPSLEMTGTVVVILKWLCFSEGCLTKLYSHMYIYILYLDDYYIGLMIVKFCSYVYNSVVIDSYYPPVN